MVQPPVAAAFPILLGTVFLHRSPALARVVFSWDIAGHYVTFPRVFYRSGIPVVQAE